jgi:Domain of unknown function (DUF4377)
VFQGEPTLEARFGPATLGFLEVAPQRVSCPDATGADGLCLHVREIRFDEQGLRVGEPGEFAPFPGAIQGFEHVEGVRNVIRVKRFQSDATPGEGVTVLDLVVESEQVKQ